MALNEAWMLMVKRDLSGEQRGNHRRRQMHSPCQSFPSVSHDGIQNTPTTVDRFSDNDIETEKSQAKWLDDLKENCKMF